MLSIPWTALTGWGAPRIHKCTLSFTQSYISRHFRNGEITSDEPLVLDPSATVFHYAQTLFEGMKAYRDENGKVTLFRPDMNMDRMNRSAARIALPVSILRSRFLGRNSFAGNQDFRR